MRHLLAAGTAAIVLLTAPAAHAAWSAAGAGAGAATATTVQRASAPTATGTGSTVTLAWARTTLANGDPVSGYLVLRHAGATTTIVCAGTDPARTCQDSSPVAGPVTYGVVARAGNAWQGAESPLTSYTPDSMPPVTTYDQSPAANAAGWNSTSVTATLTAVDTDGVASVRYQVNGGTTVVTAGSSASVPIAAEGSTTLTYWAVDVHGNVEAPRTRTVRIDSVSPASTISPVSSTLLWRTSAQVVVTGADLLSGVAQIVYAVDGGDAQTVTGTSATFTLPDGTHTVTYRSVDAAGNTHPSVTATVKVDTAGPSVGSLQPVNGASHTNNNSGQGSWSRVCGTGRVCATFEDTVSGVDAASLSFTLARGSTCWNGTAFVAGTTCSVPLVYSPATGQGTSPDIPTAAMADGAYTLSVTAKDLAGNVSTASAAFTIT